MAPDEPLNVSVTYSPLQIYVPIFLHARRVRDLRPLLRRAPQFQARGYSAVVPG